MTSKKLYLKKNEERRVNAGHLWIYSNEIDTQKTPLKNFLPGEIVSIISSRENFLAVGYINPHALISARILSRTTTNIDETFFTQQIKSAFLLRQQFFPKPFYRLIYGESDFLPGLIIDRYDQLFVVQTNTFGMENQQQNIITALTNLFQPNCIVLKNDSSMRQIEGLSNYVTVVHGEIPEQVLIEENHCKFQIPLLESQKTGWFYDHRDNRKQLSKYVKDKKVLDAFSYLGGWGIQAAKFGAQEVLCIDSSSKAIQALSQNATLNQCSEQIKVYEEDAFIALKSLINQKQKFDVIILDPPALIKKRKDLEQGIIAYLRLNEFAMQLLSQNGILISCSCSLHMSKDQLIDIIRRAGIKSNKKVQIVEIGFQDMDHPIHPAIPETAYLKAIFCSVQNQLCTSTPSNEH